MNADDTNKSSEGIMIINIGTLLGLLVLYVMLRRLAIELSKEIARLVKEDQEANDKLCYKWSLKKKPH